MPTEDDIRSILDQHQTDLEIIRGPVPLKHKEPVDAGVLGGVVLAKAATKRFVLKAVAGLAAAILAGAGGSYTAMRDALVERGRSMERDKIQADYLKALDARLAVVEKRQNEVVGRQGEVVQCLRNGWCDYFARPSTPVVVPDHAIRFRPPDGDDPVGDDADGRNVVREPGHGPTRHR